MRRKLISCIRIAAIALILLGMPGTVAYGSTEALTSDREGFLTQPVEGIDWPTAAANPQRTSWSPEEVRGTLRPLWYRPIEPHIPFKAQIIAGNGLVYVSTSAGLYAFDADTGEMSWVYPTEMPLGNSPTVIGNTLYVGGFDGRIHTINATPSANSLPVDQATGYRINDQVLWTFKAGAGFDTNPLVVDGTVYLGSRDRFFYAINAATGSLHWKYETGGPIHFSAAYQDGIVYFASNDAHAYALDTSGNLVWRSEKLPSWGFHSWWPTIVGDTVILPAARGYRITSNPQIGDERLTNADPGYQTPMGERLPDGSMRTTNAVNYLEEYPWRRSFYLLDAATGEEKTFDVDQDGRAEYAPLMYFGTNSGQRYPAVISQDGTIYTANVFSDAKYRNGISGWALGADIITTPGITGASDEPIGHSMGGNVIYWTLCCDRSGGALDVATGQQWTYYSYDLDEVAPGYDSQVLGTHEANAVQVYGGWNGVYGSHGDQNAPIPYDGKVFVHRGNAILAWSADGQTNLALPLAEAVDVTHTSTVNRPELKQKLSNEVRTILTAGHLKPGYGVGLFSYVGEVRGDNSADYSHNPGEIFYALSIASEHLPQAMKEEVEAYLEDEYRNFPPQSYTHVGWQDGVSREFSDFPPEVEADFPNHDATMWSTYDFPGWTGPDWKWDPMTFYYMWKYAQAFGNARQVFDDIENRMWIPPDDDVYDVYPFAHNAWIAGLHGYLALEKMAGYPESSDKREQLDRLLSLRVQDFEKDNPWGPDAKDMGQTFAVARNFMHMTPELGEYLEENAYGKVREAMDEYESVAPYWFVTNFEETYNEDVMRHLYDYHALFSAKAFIFDEPAEELARYLDVPAFQQGDLFYIQNLVATIEAHLDLEKAATPSFGYQGNAFRYTLSFCGSGTTLSLTDTLPSGISAPTGFELAGTSVVPIYDSSQHHLTWSDTPTAGQEVTIRYTATVTTDDRQALINVAELGEAGGGSSVVRTIVISNPELIYLPAILKKASGTG